MRCSFPHFSSFPFTTCNATNACQSVCLCYDFSFLFHLFFLSFSSLAPWRIYSNVYVHGMPWHRAVAPLSSSSSLLCSSVCINQTVKVPTKVNIIAFYFFVSFILGVAHAKSRSRSYVWHKCGTNEWAPHVVRCGERANKHHSISVARNYITEQKQNKSEENLTRHYPPV